MTPRAARADDVDALGAIAEAAELFPAAMLPDMIAGGLSGNCDLWLVAEDDQTAAGFAFARPEEMANGVWNLLALGVAPNARGKGVASGLIAEVERRSKARMIVIETTQLPDQAKARSLYTHLGYEEEGRVRDFYAADEDKVIFRKVMV